MNFQETIDSLRKVLESVIAPGVESLRLRLDAVEKELHENGQGIARLGVRVDHLSARVDHLAERMDDGFARVDARIDTLGTSINARVDHLTERMDEGFARMDARMENLAERMDARLDALTSAILGVRQPSYPDAVLSRLDKLEREIEALPRTG